MKRIVLGALLTVGALGATALPANAQALRTWVSGVGDDINPCSRTAPCKTFPGAISKTAAGGVINCLDSGSFSSVTIVKTIDIVCEGVVGGITHASANGITVNGSGVAVVIKGLDIDGGGSTDLGQNGIRFLAGASLHVENVIIRDSHGGAPNGNGILFAPSSGVAELTVKNTTILNNGVGTSGVGIQIRPTGSGAVRALIDGVTVTNNFGGGIRGDTSATTGEINITIVNSSFTGSPTNGIAAVAGTPAVNVMVDNSTSAFNAVQGVRAQGAGATIRLSNSQVTANGTGIAVASGGVVSSFGNNHIEANADNGPNPAIIVEK